MYLAIFFVSWCFVIAAVSVVLPWSTCPIVPMFTCGLLRTNFSLAIVNPFGLQAPRLRNDLIGESAGNRRVMRELHRVRGATLRRAAELRRVAEHLRERDLGGDHLDAGARLHPG